MPAIIENVKFNEESRVYFLKNTCERFLNYTKSMNAALNDSLQEVNNNFSAINCKNDVEKIFEEIHINRIEKTKFETYQTMKENKRTEEVKDIDIINSSLDLLIFQKKGKHADFNRLNKIVKSIQGKKYFLQALEARKSQPKIEMNDIQKLTSILNDILYDIGFTEESNILFYKIIELSDIFYSENNQKKTFLWNFLAAEQVLNDDSRWLFSIHSSIKEKISHEKLISLKIQKNRKSKSIFSSVKDFTSKIYKKKKNDTSQQAEKKAAIDILHDFVVKMWKLSVDDKISKSVIQTFSLEYKVDSDNIETLLAIIKPPPKILIKRSAKIITPVKYIYLQQSLPFLTVKESLSLLSLNKSCQSYLDPFIYSKCLLANTKKICLNRSNLWIKILQPYFPQADDYNEILSNISSIEPEIKSVSYIIDMDIARSYQENKISHDTLKNILKIYAFCNPEVNYCQGMNFLAGTLYFIINNERNTYNCLYGVIKKLQMEMMLGNDLNKLKCMFYKLDKLTELLLPDIYQVFIIWGIFASSYSSSWFVTLFSSSLDENLEVLYRIWDFFLVKGWKIIFKLSIFILKHWTRAIVEGSYEDCLRLFGGNNMFKGEIFNGDFMGKASQIQISKRLLVQLEYDYNAIIEESKCNKPIN